MASGQDFCAVCANRLEWVAFGRCGHKDVCHICVARLRFVMGDKRCCICKKESEVVLVSKAGRSSDLKVEELATREGNVCFEPNVGAYVEDVDSLRVLKELCRLSCTVCDNSRPQAETQAHAEAGHAFRDLQELRQHLSAAHQRLMCELCVRGRKLFVCEHKLYSKAQLKRHRTRGDFEVDGTEEEREGFNGHPLCHLCDKRFYGETELHAHVRLEHYECHFCRGARPGYGSYYRDYHHLETHFRLGHFLCEYPACLSDRFVVFATEQQMEEHIAISHGGNMCSSHPTPRHLLRGEGNVGSSAVGNETLPGSISRAIVCDPRRRRKRHSLKQRRLRRQLYSTAAVPKKRSPQQRTRNPLYMVHKFRVRKLVFFKRRVPC